MALAAGVGVAAVAYNWAPKKEIPSGARAVRPFDIDRYLGTWYEIARLPNRIEKNLRLLTEEYSVDERGELQVLTRAFHIKNEEWRKVRGKMKFAGAEDTGMLKVSYLGPVYLAYNVLAVDPDYQYAMVSGSGLNYLWILSRQATIPDDVKARFLRRAKAIGFAVDELEWV